MDFPETEIEFACAFCGEANSVAVEPEDGADQEFVVDCWVCCRPNRLHLRCNTEGTIKLRVSS